MSKTSKIAASTLVGRPLPPAPMVDRTPARDADRNETILSNVPTPREVSAVTVRPEKLLYTLQEVSERTSLSPKTLLRLIKRGKLRSLSSVRHKRIAASELARFIREN